MKVSSWIFLCFTTFVLMFPVAGQARPVNLEEIPEYKDMFLRIETLSGATFQGNLYEIDQEKLVLADRDGRLITLLRSSVYQAWNIAEGEDKRSYYQDSAANRLLVIPTGFPMETGEFHVSDQEIAAVTMSYGLSDHVSIWGGISMPGALISARYTFNLSNKQALSVGSFAGASWIDFMVVFLPYTVYSLGRPEHNFTAAAGAVIGYDGSGTDLDGAVLVLGGKWVMSDTAAIVTENWLIWGRMPQYINPYIDNYGDKDYHTRYRWDALPLGIVPGIAFRIAGEKFSWDIGAILPVMISRKEGDYIVEGLGGEERFFPLPLLSFTYRID